MATEMSESTPTPAGPMRQCEAPRPLASVIEGAARSGSIWAARVVEGHRRRAELMATPEGRAIIEAEDRRREEDNAEERRRLVAQSRFFQRMEASGIPDAYRTASLDADERGRPLVVSDGNGRAIRAAAKLAGSFERGWERGLLFYSGETKDFPGTGTGKTYLMCAVGCAVIRRGYRFRIATASRILDAIRATFGGDGLVTAEEVFQWFAVEPDILCIDELGGHDVKCDERGNWAREQMLKIVDHRRLAGLCTCATTNVKREDGRAPIDLRRVYGARFMSRLLAGATWIEIVSPDYRIRKADANDPFAEEADRG